MDIKMKLINDNLGLIYKCSKYFYGVDKKDLYQAGIIGLLNAYNNYHKDSTAKFSTYAYNYVYGSMYDLVCNKEIKYGKDLLKLKKRCEQIKNILSQELYRDPTINEIASYMQIDENIVNYALSINDSIYCLDADDDKRSMYETVEVEEKVSLDDKILLQDGINSLDDIEKNIINARYYEDLSQCETAKKLGITQAKVSRYENKSLKKIREYMYM